MGNTFKPSLIHLKTLLCFKEQPISAIEGLTVQFESKAGSRYFYIKSECIACPIIGDD
jgi:hypothetical protein